MIKKLIIFLIFLVFLASPAWGAIYYIDFTGGANTNNGLTPATAWKSHPYMLAASECTGTGSAPSYSHVAGDIFVFKGGETWPSACWTMNFPDSGTSGAIDTFVGGQKCGTGSYTCNSSVAWGTGYPVFDINWTKPTRANALRIADGNSYITLDGFEIKNFEVTTANGNAIIRIDSADHITIKNSYLHGWHLPTDITSDDAHGAVYTSYSESVSIDGCTISNTEYSGTRDSGVAVVGGNISNTTIHDVSSLALGVCNVSNSTFYNISYPTGSFDEYYHTNGLYVTGEGCVIKNNLIYNFRANAAPIYPNVGSGGSGPCQDWTQYVYNNVVMLGEVTDVYNIIDLDPEHGGVNEGYCGTVYVYNNTLQSDVNPTAIRTQLYGEPGGRIKAAYIQNNHIINGSGSGGICVTDEAGCGTPQTIVNDHNLTQSNATANAQGYVRGNNYAPGLSGETIDAGIDKSSIFTRDKMGLIRPKSLSWDIGAYEYFPGPTNLRILNQ